MTCSVFKITYLTMIRHVQKDSPDLFSIDPGEVIFRYFVWYADSLIEDFILIRVTENIETLECQKLIFFNFFFFFLITLNAGPLCLGPKMLGSYWMSSWCGPLGGTVLAQITKYATLAKYQNKSTRPAVICCPSVSVTIIYF